MERIILKNPLYADFPEREYKWRMERAASLLKEENLDGLILTQTENVYYTTGIQHVDVLKSIKDMPPTITILTQDMGTILIGRWPRSHAVIKDCCWPENIICYSENEKPADAVTRALTEHGLCKGRVGMELGEGTRLGISTNQLDLLRKRAWESASTKVVDGSAVVWRLRSVKSDFEVERLKRSAYATCRALEYAVGIVDTGMNEIDMAREAGRVMMDEGAFWYNTQVLYPPFWACVAFDVKIPKGYVCFDFGAEYRHYLTDMHRVVALGKKPSEEEKHLYNVRVEANDVIQNAVKPGKSFNEVLMKLKAFVEESGCVMPENHIGHGIGLEVHEPPKIGISPVPEPYSGSGMPGYPIRFEIGMVFTLEPNIQDLDLPMSFNCEDDVVVTETGCELLAELPREMRIKV